MRTFVLTSAFTNSDLPFVRWKSTRFLPLPRRKYLPRMISLSPTLRCVGETELITGALTAAPAVAGAASAPSAARTAAPRSIERVRDRVSIAPNIDRPVRRLEQTALG